MSTLAILPCGKRKIWDKDPDHGPAYVDEAYTGTLHLLTKRYAEIFCDEWVILSGKHGFCSKKEIIKDDYNLTFGMNEKGLITDETLKKQIEDKALDRFDQVVILTGKKHQKVIQRIGGISISDLYPLLGTRGIGEMQHLLKKAIDEETPLH